MPTPNQLTVLRIILALAIPYILLQEQPTVTGTYWAMFAFTVACITDWWDGHLARTRGLITAFGKIADPIADKLLMVGTLFSLSLRGVYGVWWVWLILIREVLVTAVRIRVLRQGKVLPAESAGKIKVGFQITALSFAFFTLLAGQVSQEEGIESVLSMMTHIALVGAVGSTWYSGIRFFISLKQGNHGA